MPNNTELLGKYSNQRNRDEKIHIYDLADQLDPEICLDLDISDTDDEFFQGQIDIFVLAAMPGNVLIFRVKVDPQKDFQEFFFGDTFGNEGKGTIELYKTPMLLKLELVVVRDEAMRPFYKEYELFRAKA